MSSVNHSIPFVPENTTDPAAGLNLAIHKIDALVQVAVLGIDDTPAVSPANGERWIVGTSPTGAWEGHENQVARWTTADNAWDFLDVILALNQDDGLIYGFDGSTWASVQGPQGPAGEAGTAAATTYDNTDSQLVAENVQDAIDELKAILDAIMNT
jgi:hypothetical protein